MQMTLKTKLGLGFGLLVAFMCVIVITGWSLIVKTKTYSEQANVEIPKLVLLFDLQNSFEMSARALRDDTYTKHDHMNGVEKELYNKGKHNFTQALDKLGNMVSSNEGRGIFNQFKQASDDTFALMDEALDLAVNNKNAEAQSMIFNKIAVPQDRMLALLNNYVQFQRQRTKGNAELVTSSSASGCAILLVLGAIGVIFGALLAIFISRSITKSLNNLVDGLRNSSSQMSDASGQVSSASKVLAEGASEQAASIEETSSSLEEMSSMTKQNADHAGQANSLANEAKETLTRAMGSMEKLTISMTDISKASEETSKIIKTIDEIAFQTNLLALNAAVEAARAGEAGAGFAVVADEVRNLAMRAAEASENTTALIEETIKKIKEGADLVLLTNDGFREVSANAAKSKELIGEISAASQEQAQGIEQINVAVCKMEHVVERNAANAEECASASEEMNVQAEQLKEFVTDLVALVGGNAIKNAKKATPGYSPDGEPAKKAVNCWEFKKCGREEGGAKVEELGTCPAYPNNGRQCARLVGTFCGGKVQGSFASKLKSCMKCAFYQSEHYNKTDLPDSSDQRRPGNGKAPACHDWQRPEQVIPFDTEASEF